MTRSRVPEQADVFAQLGDAAIPTLLSIIGKDKLPSKEAAGVFLAGIGSRAAFEQVRRYLLQKSAYGFSDSLCEGLDYAQLRLMEDSLLVLKELYASQLIPNCNRRIESILLTRGVGFTPVIPRRDK